MKTNELIRRLQEADPSGDMEVTVGKTDIYFLQKIPGYYDGCHQILKRDSALEGECYNIIGAEIRSEGQHICIETHDIRTALVDNPDFPVTYDSEYAEIHYRDRVEEWRAEARQIQESVAARVAAKKSKQPK